MQSSTKISLRGISISIIVLTMLILVIGSYRYDTGRFYATKLIQQLQLTLPGNDISISSASDPESFVLQNPCTKPTKKQRDFSAKRLVKCTTKAEFLMLTYQKNPSQLGNQMCNYAALFAISRQNNRKAWMSPSMSDYISKYFNVSSDTIEPKLYKSIKWTEMPLTGTVSESIRKINSSIPHIRLGGAAQVRQYYDDVRPLILKEFQFYDHIVQSSKSKLLTIKREYFQDSDFATIVGIHVRRGDYLKAAKIERFNVPTKEFYIGAMKYFTDKYKNVLFVIASNDLPWCEENLLLLRTTMDFHIHILQSASSKDGGLDMAILAHCDHVIYGLGTFGFWAGYLSPGEVIYCSDCITPKTGWLRNKLLYNGDYGNMVLPSWVGYSIKGVESYELAKTRNTF